MTISSFISRKAERLIKLHVSLLTAAFFACVPTDSDASLSDVQRLLGGQSVICAAFTQQKSLKALTRPLTSKGRLIFVAGKGVLWQVLEPFPARLLIKSDALIRWNDDGIAQKVNLDQTPVFRALSHVFLALFSGETDKLQDIFDVESQSARSKWRLTLVPRTKILAAIIATVRASGGRFVNEVLIEEKQGDRTSIRFTDINAESCKLGNAEKGYFAR